MADPNRPKRIHRDPYGDYLTNLVTQSNVKLDLPTQPFPDSAPYEPDEIEKALYRATLDFIKDRFGQDVMQAAVSFAGIESGEATDDDLDFDLYNAALDYVRATFGEAAYREVIEYLNSRR